jgi:hypothetical protein
MLVEGALDDRERLLDATGDQVVACGDERLLWMILLARRSTALP